MTVVRICDVQDNQVVVPLPAYFKDKKVRVVIDDSPVSEEDKMALMSQAANDPLFLADVAEIGSDFNHLDNELVD